MRTTLRSVLLCIATIAFPYSQFGAIIRWGNGANGYGQSAVPQEPSVQTIAAGHYHSLALRSDGTVVGWGASPNGETNVPAGLSSVTGIAAGGGHSLARKSDGTVVAWGANSYGQTTIPQGLSGVVAVAAGLGHSLALKSNGTVVGWGWTGYGGPNGPISIPAGLSGVTAISAGYVFSMALKSDGTVVAWGQAPGGPIDVSVPAGLLGVTAIAAGTYHALALKGDGTVVSWGWNAGSETNVPPGLTGVIAIAAGDRHSLALKSDGTVVGWGSYPPVPEVVLGATAIAAGYGYSIASGASVGMTPQIDLHPIDSTSSAGSNVVFAVQAQSGAPALVYQWHFNGIPMSGQTNPVLSLTNIQSQFAGNYSVMVSNTLGSALSRTAKLSVRASNDSFGSPLLIPAVGGRTFSSNADATKEPLEPNHAGAIGGKSVWFLWQAPTSGSVNVDTIGSSFDTVLAVYVGSALGSLAVVAADDDGAGFQGNSRLSFQATQGTSYRIAVDSYSSGIGGGSGGVILNLLAAQPVLGGQQMSQQRVFQFQANGPVGRQVALESSIDLTSWSPVATNVVPEEGVLSFLDVQATGVTRRFFRTRVLP